MRRTVFAFAFALAALPAWAVPTHAAAPLPAAHRAISGAAHAATSANASSDYPPGFTPGFDVVSQMNYCRNGSSACGASGADSMQVFVAGAHGQLSGTPDGVFLECDHWYTARNGDLRRLSGGVFTGPAAFNDLYPGIFDPGSISGLVLLGPNPTETNTMATSAFLGLRATDTTLGDTAYVNGGQITDNSTDTPVVSGVSLVIVGKIRDMDTVTGTTTVNPHGGLACSSAGKHPIEPSPSLGFPPYGGFPIYAEAEAPEDVFAP